MKETYYFDSFETQVLFEVSSCRANLQDTKQVLKLQLSAMDKGQFFGVHEFLKFQREVDQIKRHLNELVNMPNVKTIININKQYPQRPNCLARISNN